MSVLDPADWSFPVPIRYGPGRLAELGAVCASVDARRPLVVTDRGSAELPFVQAAIDSIEAAGLTAGLFAGISPNPTDADVALGKDAFVAGNHDAVVALGGGSGMDGGKAISLVARSGTNLWDFDYDNPLAPSHSSSDFVPLITVPTTAGTGAETESTAMVTDTDQGIKRCIWHETHSPTAAILDPEVTLGLPANLTAWTGVDALVHAIEALSVPDWHPMCDGMAVEAIRLISSSLPTAVATGDNIEARGTMLVGSCLGGISFLKGLGLVHAMSHMVGAVHDTHHGLTNAVLLPVVLQYNKDALGPKVALMAEAMQLTNHDFDSFYGAIVELLDSLDIPRGLADIGVDHDRLGEIASKAHGDAAAATNPVPATVEQIHTLLDQGFRSSR